MRNPRTQLSWILLALLVVISACGSKPAQTVVKAEPVTLQQIRAYAAEALDGNIQSDQRSAARDAAVRSLLRFLTSSESVRLTKSDWERPAVASSGPLMRYFESGKVRVFALALPGPGIVPPGERVIVQYLPPGGAPIASELKVLTGHQLISVRGLEESGQLSLTAAFGHPRGGGYVSHYTRDSRSGEFRPAPTALRGLPFTIGDFTLEPYDEFLRVSTPIPEPWRPLFEVKQPLRLFLDADVALDWKGGRFVLLDERSFSAFQGFLTALDVKAAKPEREEAWEKATRRLPEYLGEMESWAEDLSARLPLGALTSRDAKGTSAVRLISIPAPEGLAHSVFSVLQYRSGGGLPSAQTLTLPGLAEGIRLVTHQGLPGLLILSDVSTASRVKKAVSLYRMTAGNIWEPAPEWFGFIPKEPGWWITRAPSSPDLVIEWVGRAGFDKPAISMAIGADIGVQLCHAPTDCVLLNWIADSFGGAGWVREKLRALTTVGTGFAAERQVLEAISPLTAYLSAPSTIAITPTELITAIELDLQVFQPDQFTRLVGMPTNSAGLRPLLLQTSKGIVVETHETSAIEQWLDARVVTAGGTRWLVVLGRARESVSVILYRWEGDAWVKADALEQRVDRLIRDRVKLSYVPRQTNPVRGLVASGSAQVNAKFTSDGTAVQICETLTACATYFFGTRWQLR